ncbi:MAG: nicotinate-nucleotide adenylyltransferase [Saprospiraceae bacterium]|nr:nicotinate-nucleotide adenylyltransferase [Saprospiraceae bacterium]
MQTGLFFGSFNPIHIGHLIIANHMVEYGDLTQVWMVVSPHNPLKPKKTLARDFDRLHLVRLAVEDNSNLRASNVEFDLPQPSYTVDTLAYLADKFPERKFTLIMGGDNLASLHKWKNYEQILEHYPIYVYQRPGAEKPVFGAHPNVRIFEAPLLHISATYIRQARKEGKSVRYLVPDPVFEYLDGSDMYKK